MAVVATLLIAGLHCCTPESQLGQLEVVSPSAAQQSLEVFEYVLTYNSQWFEQARESFLLLGGLEHEF